MNNPNPNPNPTKNQENLNTKHNLTNNERGSIIQFLLERSVNKVLCYGAINEASEKFSVHRSTIHRVWRRGLSSLEQGNTLMDASTLTPIEYVVKYDDVQKYVVI